MARARRWVGIITPIVGRSPAAAGEGAAKRSKEYLPVGLAVRDGTTVQARSGTDRTDCEEGLHRFRDEAPALIAFDSHPSSSLATTGRVEG